MFTAIDIKRIEAFYLKAASATYAGDAPVSTIAEIPGSKVLRCEEGSLLYINVHWTNGDFSDGVAHIWDKTISEIDPVWVMNYHDWCKNDNKDVISFLKSALKNAFEKGQFIGSQGQFVFSEDNSDYVYTDELIPTPLSVRQSNGGNIHSFSGRKTICYSSRRTPPVEYRYDDSGKKKIYRPRKLPLFERVYNGMLMGPVDPEIINE